MLASTLLLGVNLALPVSSWRCANISSQDYAIGAIFTRIFDNFCRFYIIQLRKTRFGIWEASSQICSIQFSKREEISVICCNCLIRNICRFRESTHLLPTSKCNPTNRTNAKSIREDNLIIEMPEDSELLSYLGCFTYQKDSGQCLEIKCIRVFLKWFSLI